MEINLWHILIFLDKFLDTIYEVLRRNIDRSWDVATLCKGTLELWARSSYKSERSKRMLYLKVMVPNVYNNVILSGDFRFVPQKLYDFRVIDKWSFEGHVQRIPPILGPLARQKLPTFVFRSPYPTSITLSLIDQIYTIVSLRAWTYSESRLTACYIRASFWKQHHCNLCVAHRG